jgi:hypothetical protein
MFRRRRIVVLGVFANVPYAGMAWMHGQFLMGLAELGHDVSYIEMTTVWPYHPLQATTTTDPGHAIDYLADVMTGFGLPEAWAYRAAYADGRWYGPQSDKAWDLLRSADAVLNITGSTTPAEIGVECRLVYIETDPALPEIKIANGDAVLRERLAAHQAHFTYGENIGAADCLVPPLPFPTHAMRQPVVLARWATTAAPRPVFTTVTNWEVTGYDIEWRGERYTWSKHHALRRVMDLPGRASATLELALGSSGVSEAVRAELRGHGWLVADAFEMSRRPWPYAEYIRTSLGEFSVSKDLVVRTRCGWFSERSACYLAAGRPVVTEDTGFGCALPVGEGLISFRTADEAAAALEQVLSDYPRHSRAARAVAEDYFAAGVVLNKLMADLGL